MLKIAVTSCAVAFALALPSVARAQNPGSALRFDGTSDLVRLVTTSAIMGSGWQTTKTASLWVKPTGTSNCTNVEASTCDAIMGDRPRSWGISRGVIGGSDRIWVWNTDGTLDRIGIEYTVGQWVHVALVHGSGTLSAYKNGQWVGSIASGPTPQIGGQPVLHLGGIINSTASNWTFQGEIDEVQLWQTARTAAEIGQDWNRILTGGEAGLSAYYRMSNGSGSTLTDDSGHGRTGTLLDGSGSVPPDGPILWVPSGAFGGGGDPDNTPPVADPKSITTAEDAAVPVILTGSDVDEDPLTFRVVQQPGYGSLTGSAPNLTYTPGANFNGSDVIGYVANDGFVDSGVATISVTVTPVNDDPEAVDDVVSTGIDDAVSIGVLDNDLDADEDPLTVTDVDDPAHGTVSFNGSHITYTPDPGFDGTDTFTYYISDGNGGDSSAEVTVTVSSGLGFALRFDGASDFVVFGPTSEMLAPGWQSNKTIELWVRPTGTSFCLFQTAPHCDAIFGDRPRWWGISRGVIGGLDRIWVWNVDPSFKVIGVEYVPGEWLHLAMVHANGVMSAYKNGVLVGSVATGATQQPYAGAIPYLQIGGVINTVTRNWTFSGEIDEVRMWNTARTAQQISEHMNQELGGTEYGLAAYYRMSNGAGTVATDDSGHGWTGTLHDGGQGVPADGPIQWVPSGAFGVP